MFVPDVCCSAYWLFSSLNKGTKKRLIIDTFGCYTAILTYDLSLFVRWHGQVALLGYHLLPIVDYLLPEQHVDETVMIYLTGQLPMIPILEAH